MSDFSGFCFTNGYNSGGHSYYWYSVFFNGTEAVGAGLRTLECVGVASFKVILDQNNGVVYTSNGRVAGASDFEWETWGRTRLHANRTGDYYFYIRESGGNMNTGHAEIGPLFYYAY